MKTICFLDEFAWVRFLHQVQREQLSEHWRTKHSKKHSAERVPATCRKNASENIDVGAQNGSKITPGGLSETAGAPRSSQEQQTATKNRTTDPRAAQERPKSVPKRLKGRTTVPDKGSARLGPDRWGGVGEG